MRGSDAGIHRVSEAIAIRPLQFLTSKSSQITNHIIMPPYGDPGNVVQNVRTLYTYPSQGELARQLDVTPAMVSHYFAGRIPHLKGDQYTRLGKAGQPLAV
jgi:hypothetical protein